MSLGDFIAGGANEQESIKRQFATSATVATHIQFFNEQIVTSQTNTKAELRGLGSSFILGDSSYGKLGSSNTTTFNITSGVGFDGSNDYGSIPYISQYTLGSNDFTIEFFIKTSQSPAVSAGIFESSDIAATPNTGFRVQLQSTGSIYLELMGNSNDIVAYSQSINNGNWHHIACIRYGGSSMVFTDGTSGAKSNTNYSINNIINRNILLGVTSGAAGFTRYFTGSLDEIRFSSGARYTSNFIVGSTEFANDTSTLGLWHLDEGTGSVFADASTNANTGSWFNGVGWNQGNVYSGNTLTVNPQPYLGTAGAGAFSVVMNQSPGSPFINTGLTNIRDWMLGSASNFTPTNIQLGSGTQVWSGNQSGLQYQTASLTANRYGEGNQLGSFQVTVSSVNRTGNGSYTEMGIGSGTVSMMRDTFPLVYLGPTGSEARFTMSFRTGS